MDWQAIRLVLRFGAVLSALLLQASQPVALGLATGAAVFIVQAPVRAQTAEEVATVATAITVRIESATQGSGVIVSSSNGQYRVLTAWHVVKSYRPGEEIDIITSDGKFHTPLAGSIRKIGDLDLAELSFRSSTRYTPVEVVDSSSISTGARIFVSGFPLPTQAVPKRVFRFLDGMVIANASIDIPKGYSLLYSNKTLPGMSGGAVLNESGELIGIHGQGETDFELSKEAEIAVKTGTNQGIPSSKFSIRNTFNSPDPASDASPGNAWISRVSGWISRLPSFGFKSSNETLGVREIKSAYMKPTSASDHLAIASSLESQKQEICSNVYRLSDLSECRKLVDNQILNARLASAFEESAQAYLFEALGYDYKYHIVNKETRPPRAPDFWRKHLAPLQDKRDVALSKALEIDPNNLEALLLKAQVGPDDEKISAYSKVLEKDPLNPDALYGRAVNAAGQGAFDAQDYFKELKSRGHNEYLFRKAISGLELGIQDREKLNSLGLREFEDDDDYIHHQHLLFLAELYDIADIFFSSDIPKRPFAVEWLYNRACQHPKIKGDNACLAYQSRDK